MGMHDPSSGICARQAARSYAGDAGGAMGGAPGIGAGGGLQRKMRAPGCTLKLPMPGRRPFHGNPERGAEPPGLTRPYRPELRLTVPQPGHGCGWPPCPAGMTRRSRGIFSGSSDARYASIAVRVALFLRSSITILS